MIVYKPPPTGDVRDLRAGGNPCGSPRQLVDPPSSLRCRAPLQSETALPEANSFPCGCQPFCRIPIGFFRLPRGPYIGLWAMWCWGRAEHRILGGEFDWSPLGWTKFDQANTHQYPHTVARKSAMRLRPGLQMPGDRAGQQLARPLSEPPASRCKRERPDGWESLERDNRGECRGQGQADLSAEQPAPSPRTRLPVAHADPRGPCDRVRPAS